MPRQKRPNPRPPARAQSERAPSARGWRCSGRVWGRGRDDVAFLGLNFVIEDQDRPKPASTSPPLHLPPPTHRPEQRMGVFFRRVGGGSGAAARCALSLSFSLPMWSRSCSELCCSPPLLWFSRAPAVRHTHAASPPTARRRLLLRAARQKRGRGRSLGVAEPSIV